MIIETNRLLLREWKMSDIDDLVEGFGDFDTTKNLTVPYPYLSKDSESFIKAHGSHQEDSYYFAIELKGSGKVIGGTNINILGDKVKGGIWINKDYQGRGYGSEAFRARAKFAFESLGVRELENGFFDFNKRSWHMQEKIGYEIVGEKKNFSPTLNKEVTEIITILTKEKFYKNNC